MTTNQNAFAKLVEERRHNQETERQGQASINESVRHNKASETYYTGSLEEAIRHNKVSEGQNQAAILNNYTVGMSQAAASATQAAAATKQAEVAATNAETNRMSAQSTISLNEVNSMVKQAEQQETARHNKSEEQLTASRDAWNAINGMINAAANVFKAGSVIAVK